MDVPAAKRSCQRLTTRLRINLISAITMDSKPFILILILRRKFCLGIELFSRQRQPWSPRFTQGWYYLTKSKRVRTNSRPNSENWWAYYNRGMALEDLATSVSASHKDCGKVIDFTPPKGQNLDFTPTTFKTKTSQMAGAFLGMTEQFKHSLFRFR